MASPSPSRASTATPSDNDASATSHCLVVVNAEAIEGPSAVDFENSGGVPSVSRGNSDHDHAAQSGTGSGGANSLCGVAVDARDGEGLAMTLDQVEVDPSRGRRP